MTFFHVCHFTEAIANDWRSERGQGRNSGISGLQSRHPQEEDGMLTSIGPRGLGFSLQLQFPEYEFIKKSPCYFAF